MLEVLESEPISDEIFFHLLDSGYDVKRSAQRAEGTGACPTGEKADSSPQLDMFPDTAAAKPSAIKSKRSGMRTHTDDTPGKIRTNGANLKVAVADKRIDNIPQRIEALPPTERTTVADLVDKH